MLVFVLPCIISDDFMVKSTVLEALKVLELVDVGSMVS